MDRYQKTSDKPSGKALERVRDKSKTPKTPLGRTVSRWQNRLDRTIDQYVTRHSELSELLFVPKDLHTTDPSLMSEISSGHFGLDGIFMEVGEGHPSIFAAPHADDSFNRALHGFGWLRDLRARADATARHEAQRLVFEWIDKCAHADGVAYEPVVIAQRITSWLSHSPFILEAVDPKKSGRFMASLEMQVSTLDSKLNKMPKGLSRQIALGTLVMAGLCLSRHSELLEKATPLFLLGLEKQVYADGGHSSRNPDAILQLLFQIIPLKKCFERRAQDVPEQLDNAIERMLPMIRFFRLGDSSLARFNGTSTTPTDALAVLLAYDERNRSFDAHANQSGYNRIQDGPTTILCDIGSPPLDEAARSAHAGCLSFEMSVRHFAMVVNCGAFQGDDGAWRRFSRSTLAHSTLSFDSHSSGGFNKNGVLTGPHDIQVDRADLSGLDVLHHGYRKQFGFSHRRSLELSHQGLRLTGIDQLEGRGHTNEARYDIRFHLHPLVEIAQSDEDNLLLTLPDGEIWRFHARGAQIKMDDSVYLAYRRGPQPTHQIVLTGTARVGTKISWLFEQYRARPVAS